MFKNYLSKLKVNHLIALRNQKGQSLIIFVFAILGLIAMMGLALDLGLVYIERVRVSRTADAAALAAVVELPFEEEAMRRAIEYIELNGYTPQDTEIRVRGCIDTGGTLSNVGDGNTAWPGTDPVDTQPDSITSGYTYPIWVPPTEPRAIFVIDTLAYQPVERDASNNVTTENQENCGGPSNDPSSLFGTANKLRVSGQVNVRMNFMQFFGFGIVPVSDQAVGENVTNLDVVVVFDISGSMNFETNCFGCWNEVPSRSADIMNNPFPSNGDFNPLKYDPPGPGGPYNVWWDGNIPGSAGHSICSSNPAPRVEGGYHYSIHEAEFYSRDEPIHGWEFEKRSAGQGFWVLQRPNRGSNNSYIRAHPLPSYSQGDLAYYPQVQGGSYNAECFDGAGNYSGKCWETRANLINETPPSNIVPYVEYDFKVDWATEPDNKTNIWIRAIGGSQWSFEWYGQSAQDLRPWRETIYWQVDSNPVGGGPFDSASGFRNQGNNWAEVNDGDWRWLKIADGLNLADGQHVLRFYQGSAGFNLDKIIITNNPAGVVGSVQTNFLGSAEGPEATQGSATREACNICNPAFGQTVDPAQCSCRKNPGDTGGTLYGGGGTGVGCTRVLTTTNQLDNDLFHDIDPIRSAQEAVKNFAARLDPKFDQIGVVAFTNNIRSPRVKLQCLKYEGAHNTDGQAGCYDPTKTPISYTRTIQAIEDQSPTSGTDISEGMREGLEELGIGTAGHGCNTFNPDTYTNGDGQPCDRQGAARRVLVLMTDGSPNENLSGACTSYVWRGQFAGGGGTNSYDCAMYYAQQAADNNIVLYTIGIGSGVNRELLTAMATGQDPNPAPGDDGKYFESRGGDYFPAAKPSDLDAIFDKILNNIFVRIVG